MHPIGCGFPAPFRTAIDFVFFAPEGYHLMTISDDHDIMLWSERNTMPGRGKKSIHQVAISEFKAKCLSLLEEVNKTKTPLRVTRRGKPIADVTPPAASIEERGWIGSMSGWIDIKGNVISPVIDTRNIEVLRR
jgi:prevent-host-death family protein